MSVIIITLCFVILFVWGLLTYNSIQWLENADDEEKALEMSKFYRHLATLVAFIGTVGIVLLAR